MGKLRLVIEAIELVIILDGEGKNEAEIEVEGGVDGVDRALDTLL